MTVGELKKALDAYPEHLEVCVFEYNGLEEILAYDVKDKPRRYPPIVIQRPDSDVD